MRNYRRATWLIMGLWFLLCLATLDYNGPFFDEGIYVTGGLRALDGQGFSDRYLGWFSGYLLLWPVLAALGYKVAGLIGTRIVALLLGTIAFVATVQAARNLFGQKASFWAAATFALNGPFLALARLGVHDTYALAGIATSFYAVTELKRRDHRIGLVVAATAFTIGTFAKYPMGLMLLPILGVMLVLRKRKAVTDIAIFGFISAALALALSLPVREQLATFPGWRLANKPEFGTAPVVIGFAILYYSAAPLLLALGGWFVARDKRGLASVLVLSLTIWPAYHLILRDPVSTNKHLVFGYLFAYPLVGLGLSALWGDVRRSSVARRGAAILIVLALAAIGLVQMNQSDHAWPDTREAASYLITHVQPGQKLLINESWPYTMVLYAEGRIHSPWDVFDVYRITHGESEIDLCAYDWFVDAQGSYQWPESVLQTMKQCGNFRQVFSTTSTVVGLGSDLNFVSYPVPTTIWQNTLER
jgi:4-amino-4-deoxy-L-arabinose transferase-like glycosyltransferase